jgi:predicted small metal-binding protein
LRDESGREHHMYEFVCIKIIPGCTYQEKGDTPEAIRERAVEHLHEHHGMDYIDNPQFPDVSLAVVRTLG